MTNCICSERPLGILSSRYDAADNTPVQILKLGCTNKKCSKFNIPVIETSINLIDNSETTRTLATNQVAESK